MSNAVKSEPNADLKELALEWGVQLSFEDVSGKQRTTSVPSLLKLLALLGAPVREDADVALALRERRLNKLRTTIEPVYIAWDGWDLSVRLRLPESRATGAFAATLEQEDGVTRNWAGRLEELPTSDRQQLEGASYFSRTLSADGRIPLGYHRLRVEIGGEEFQSSVISAPTRAYAPRGNGWEREWGVFLPLYALGSAHNWGAGDFTDLGALKGWAQSLGAGLVGTLPLLAAFLDEPYECSPYSPVSRLFWNEFYLDVTAVPELSRSAAASKLVESKEVQAELRELRKSELVDYRRGMALKRRVLEELSRQLFNEESDRRLQFERYVAEKPTLADYAWFRAVGERLRKPWRDWPDDLSEYDEGSRDSIEQAKRYHMYVQWLADEQLKAAADSADGCGLYLDLPLGVNVDGYDVWRDPSIFGLGAAGGCPPDIVFPRGQNWGFVPLHPQNIRTQGYRYIREYLRHQLRFAKVLRIDHMASFHRVYWIPEGIDAADGAYVNYPAEELYAIFSLESHRHETILVGEDLGTVPPEVPKSMARHNVHRMFVVQYELSTDQQIALPEPPASSIASINTHDMPPFAGFWTGSDLDERAAAGLLDDEHRQEEETSRHQRRASLTKFMQSQGLSDGSGSAAEVLEALLRQLGDSPARLVLVNLEDLWHETCSQNIPSSRGEQTNWQRKARLSFEDFSRDPAVLRQLQQLAVSFRHCD